MSTSNRSVHDVTVEVDTTEPPVAITFPAFPHVFSQAYTLDEVEAQARDALTLAIAADLDIHENDVEPFDLRIVWLAKAS